jgi:hypothetical protein
MKLYPAAWYNRTIKAKGLHRIIFRLDYEGYFEEVCN